MKQSPRSHYRLAALGRSALALLIFAAPSMAQVGGAANDPALVKGAEACGECHTAELDAWKQTHHSKTFAEMHRRPEAKEIVQAMGGKRIKRDEHCLQCHYTEGLRSGKPRAMWGITCESCHAQSASWIDVHSDFGGADATATTETAEHREARLAKTESAGMIRPDMTYEAAANCFQCHTVPDEKLVNIGGHTVRSEFELVAWSQGEVRHNYYHSPDQKNRDASEKHKRVLYIVGRALDLEYSLRAAAKATEAGTYLDSAKQAVAQCIDHLDAVQAAHSLPEIASMLEVAKGVVIAPGNPAGIVAAAESVSKAAKAFVERHDGSALGAIDSLLPATSDYKGQARP